MLSGIDTFLGVTGVVLEIALATILIRHRLWRRDFPLFFAYVCYAIVDVVGLLLIARYSSKRAYAHAYWIAQAVYAVLGILAMDEAFRRVFSVYYFRRSWFRLLTPGLVLFILSICIWKWLRHAPIQAGPLTMAYISFDLAMNYILAGIFGLFGLLVFFWRTKWQRHPFGILLGFGAFSVVGMLADALRSDFGTKMDLIFSYAAAVAYIVACAIWLHAFTRNDDDGGNRLALPVDVGELLQLLERNTQMLDRKRNVKRCQSVFSWFGFR
jgi:lysylphosphatidylglycerol synthetase-like protein (DUF2156 family)